MAPSPSDGRPPDDVAESLLTPSRSRSDGDSVLGASCLDHLDGFTVLGDSARISVDSRSSAYLEALAGSQASHVSAMSTDFGRIFLEESGRAVAGDRHGSARAREDEARSSGDGRDVFGGRRRRGGRHAPVEKRTKLLREVDFDPAPDEASERRGGARRDGGPDARPSSPRPGPRPPHRATSGADAGVRGLAGRRGVVAYGAVGAGGRRDAPSYEEALQSLADSMRRTERSRRQVMMQRAAMGAARPVAPGGRRPPGGEGSPPSEGAFFSVSGGTLTEYSDHRNGR